MKNRYLKRYSQISETILTDIWNECPLCVPPFRHICSADIRVYNSVELIYCLWHCVLCFSDSLLVYCFTLQLAVVCYIFIIKLKRLFNNNTKYSKTLIVYLTLIGCYSINIFCFISEQIDYRCKADVASYVKLKRQIRCW